MPLQGGKTEIVTFSIRDATPDDVNVLREIFRRSALSNEGDRSTLLANQDALEFSPPAETDGHSRVAVADGHRIVGFATPVVVRDIIELEDLFVDPDWMRRGVGRALIVDAMEVARQHGIQRIEVTANPHALAFYEKTGFAVDHDVATRFGPGPRMHLVVS
jgi:GNAT superfamily N-acetyltransferase